MIVGSCLKELSQQTSVSFFFPSTCLSNILPCFLPSFLADVTISDASSVSAVVADIWKSVLVSLRVLEDDMEMMQYTTVTVVPKFDGTSRSELESAIGDIMDCLTSSAGIFQPDIARDVQLLEKKDESGEGGDTYMVALRAQRTKSRVLSFEDFETELENDDFPATVMAPEAWSNNIASFPFPSVYDFISEINRPCDQETMGTLRFTFQVKDFKYDLTKMKKKKKNPQEIIDSINCKLTRLR